MIKNIRSYLCIIALIIVTVFVAGGRLFLHAFLDAQQNRVTAAYFFRICLKCISIIAGLKIKVEGLENIPQMPYIIASRHESALDIIILSAVFNMPAFIAKSSLKWLPIIGLNCIVLGIIFINRNKPIESTRIIRNQGKKQIDSGQSILIFPEGRRLQHDEFTEYKSGGVTTLFDLGIANLKIVPIALNTGLYCPKSWIFTPGTATIKILPPITPSSDRKATIAELKEKIDNATKLL